MAVAQRMTADEFLAVEGERRWTELIEGVIVVNEPSWGHQVVLGRLFLALSQWTAAGPGRGTASLSVDVRMNERNVFGPDAMWFAEGRASAADPPEVGAVPDVAVEIRSPSTWRYDVGAKRRVYEERSLPELWLIDTVAETVLVFGRSGARSAAFDVALELAAGESLRSPRLPGFALPVADLFAR